MIGEPDLFRGHRLRFHDELRLLRAADRGDDPAGLLGVDGAVDLCADGLRLSREALDQGRQVVDGFRFPERQVRAETLPVHFGHARVAALPQLGQCAPERGPQPIVRQGVAKAPVELGL